MDRTDQLKMIVQFSFTQIRQSVASFTATTDPFLIYYLCYYEISVFTRRSSNATCTYYYNPSCSLK